MFTGRKYLFVRNAATGPSLFPSVAQQRGESTQAEIIMVLLGQLLHGQRVEGEDLLSQELWAQRRRWVMVD